MSSLFKGLSSVLTPGTTFPTSPTSNPSTDLLRFGQVLDVILDDTSDYYGSDVGIGIIRFRLMPDDISLAEKDISRFAFPVDRANFKVPLPGEQVIIYTIKVASQLYFGYGQIIQNAYNNVYNSDPFLATRVKYVEQDPLGLSTLQAGLSADVGKGFAKRFNEKLSIPAEVYEAAVKHPPLNLREGDTTIQGRFGAQVRFTSTLEDVSTHKNVAATKIIGDNVLTGKSGLATSDGDPIVILQAAKLTPATEKGFTNNDRLDDNSIVDAESSIYLTSTQSIPLEVACSRTMFTWNITLITKENSKEIDVDSSTLSQFFPETFDPNDVFIINAAGTLIYGGDSHGYGGPGGVEVVDNPTATDSSRPLGSNGNLDPSQLKRTAMGVLLEINAANDWDRLVAQARADGVPDIGASGYRTFKTQNAIFDWDLYVATGGSRSDTAENYKKSRSVLKKKIGTNGKVAVAFPGTSNHGWGRAVDASGNRFKKWLKIYGWKYNWSWYEGKSIDEDWHFTWTTDSSKLKNLSNLTSW